VGIQQEIDIGDDHRRFADADSMAAPSSSSIRMRAAARFGRG
jgi:hypothetical protein